MKRLCSIAAGLLIATAAIAADPTPPVGPKANCIVPGSNGTAPNGLLPDPVQLSLASLAFMLQAVNDPDFADHISAGALKRGTFALNQELGRQCKPLAPAK